MTGQVIVLDGPDASGKSTLADEILHQNSGNGKIIHLTYRWGPKIYLYHVAGLKNALKVAAEGGTAIIDRWWISESVYGYAFRDGPVSTSYGVYLDNMLRHVGGRYIIALPRRDVWWENYLRMCNKRDEMYGADERMKRVYDLFQSFLFQKAACPNGSALQQVCTTEGSVYRMYDFTEHDCGDVASNYVNHNQFESAKRLLTNDWINRHI